MSKITPITREEMLLDGEDLTPITRKEKFIKRIYDKTQEIPEPITREEMFLKKAGEGSGGDVTIEQLNVTENGTYSEEGKAFSPVVVEVPQPTMTKLTATENGTYTAPSGTAYNEVEVDVPLPENAYLLEEYSDVPTDIASFTASDAPLKSLTASIVPVQAGSGDPSPTNIRPISGWDEANVSVVGKNLAESGHTWNINANGVIENINLYNSSVVYVKQGKTYVYSYNGVASNIGVIAFYTSKPTIGSTSYNASRTIPTAQSTFVAPITGWAVIRDIVSATNIQAELGSTATEYEPYNPNSTTYNVEFKDGDNPLTVYGGTLDVVSGVLTVDRVSVDMGTLNWTTLASGRHGAFIGDGKFTPTNTDIANALSSQYIVTSATDIPNIDSSFCYGANGVANLLVNDSRYNGEDASDFKTHMDGVQLVYELATPLTIQLTPTAVKSLDGVNNVWASTGEIETLEYFTKEA